MAVLTF